MSRWCEENKDNRSVLCVVSDENKGIKGALVGNGLPVIVSLAAMMLENPEWKTVVKEAIEVSDNPTAFVIMAIYLKGRAEGTGSSDKSDSSLIDFLKTVIDRL